MRMFCATRAHDQMFDARIARAFRVGDHGEAGEMWSGAMWRARRGICTRRAAREPYLGRTMRPVRADGALECGTTWRGAERYVADSGVTRKSSTFASRGPKMLIYTRGRCLVLYVRPLYPSTQRKDRLCRRNKQRRRCCGVGPLLARARARRLRRPPPGPSPEQSAMARFSRP